MQEDTVWIAVLALALAGALGALAWTWRAHRRLLAERQTLATRMSDLERAYLDAPLGLAMLDRELRYTRINRLLADLNGIPIEAHIGRTVRSLLPQIASQVEGPFMEVLRTGQPKLGLVFTGETVAMPGVLRYWKENVYPIVGPTGRVEGLNVAVEEITEQTRLNDALRASGERERQRAAELEAVRLATPAAILISQDVHCDRIIGNPESERLLRMAQGSNPSANPSEHAHMRPYKEYLDGRLLAPHELPMQIAARTGQDVRALPIDFIFDNGDVVHTLATAAPLRNEKGQVRGAVGAFVDITAIKRAEQTVVLESRRKDEFLATLAHELRNPLAAIQTGLELMRLPGKAGDARVRDTMERQLRHLVRLIDDLLDVSRISYGKLELKKEIVDLRAVIERAVELSEQQIASAGHTLESGCEGGPYFVEADVVRLAQVLANLLSNAAKYTPHGGRIGLHCRREEQEVVVDVTDTGIGIEPEVLPKVFDMFSQIESGRGFRQGGMGVGLSLAQQLVQLHGGTLTVASPGAGQGSTFTVRLPLSFVERRQEMRPVPAAVEDPPATHKRILVLDDNVDAAGMLSELLALGGHDIRVAHSGVEAIRLAGEFRPELAFLDIGLPDMSGYDVARALRGDPALANMTLVALTGWGSEKDRADSRAAGFDVHLTKPITLTDLNRILPHGVPEPEG
ncbi:response regulator [Massilia arenosa]|uniref:histidine kinase n=1 Tax=Zemynaea arenosa TaxID=2561931 RepID=A0A4Y9SZ30_9BURK|nr:ATP-binding protein [Massilia arenosa]TFW29986.1 response regulator [Massilia arenosa]